MSESGAPPRRTSQGGDESAVLSDQSPEQKEYAIDLLVTLVVEELEKDPGGDPTSLLSAFVASKTGALLYDESSKLWWNGPSYIAELYREEQRKGL